MLYKRLYPELNSNLININSIYVQFQKLFNRKKSWYLGYKIVQGRVFQN